MLELLRLIPIRQGEKGVIVHEEDCLLQAGDDAIRTRCRVVFDLTEFPSAAVEIRDVDFELGKTQPVSLQFLESGFELRDGMLGGTPLYKRAPGDPFGYRMQYTEPIGVTNQQKSNSVEALLFNMGAFAFKGLPTDLLQLSAGQYRFTIRPIPREYDAVLPAISTPWHRPTNLLTLAIDGDGASSTDLQNATV